jgi:hypothetical protein
VSESILNTVKKALGLAADYDAFDQELIVHINSALMTASQIGVGPASGYSITGAGETWEDFLGDKVNLLSAVQTYIYMKVRLVFDPPANSFVVNSFESQIKELEWRLDVRVEEGKNNGG